MKKKNYSVRLLFALMALGGSLHSQSIPNDSLYLGQTPPTTTPKQFFLPVSTGFFAAERIAISSDGTRIYYSELDGYTTTSILRIKYFVYQNNKWNGPFTLFENYMAPVLSPDEKTLYFQDRCVVPIDAWYASRIDSGWSAPARFWQESSNKHYLRSIDSTKFYVSANPGGTIGGMDWCKISVNGHDTTIQSLGRPLNSTGDDLDFFISKDERYMILSIGSNSSALYISYKKSDNTWTNPKNMGAINTGATYAWGSFVTADNRYLFYSKYPSSASDRIYWVKIDNLIDNLKHTNFIPYLNIQIPSITDTVGHPFNYQFPEKTFVDDDGNNTLTYKAKLSRGAALPLWLSFDSVSCRFSGTPTGIGNYTITVTATDTANTSASCTFTLTVVASTSVSGSSAEHANEWCLYQNFPDPFNPSTAIRYTLPVAGTVLLKIYDELGREVITLANERQAAGMHQLAFNASKLTSGIYYYRLQSGTFSQVKKMVVIK